MVNNPASWDSIPSLEEIKIDWDFEPENPMGKRAYSRLTTQELCKLFQVKNIQVVLVTEKLRVKMLLLDISQGGISLRAKAADLKELQLVKIGFFLGQQKVISKGRIRNIRNDQDGVIVGIEFVGLSEENNSFLSGIYSSAKL